MFVCMGFPGGSVAKNPPDNTGDAGDGFDSQVGKIPWKSKWQSTPVFLLGKPHGQRSLASYSPWSCKSRTLLSMHACMIV